MENIFEIKNLKIQYKKESIFSQKKEQYINAVNDVSIEIRKGEILGLVGESGCGKSTFGRGIIALEKIYGGEIYYRGKNILENTNIKEFRKSVQMIFQNPYSSLNPRMKIYDILKEPLIVHGIKSKKEIDSRIIETSELTGIDIKALNYYPHEFSGGQRQRIAIASAIILKPEFIVADEPVSALDVSIRAQIINLLKDLREQLKLTILFISHDLSVVRYICDRTAVMYLGEIIELADSKNLFENPKHPYTKILLKSVPTISQKAKEKFVLKGDIPSPLNLPEGCKFHTRCPEIFHKCEIINPEIIKINENHCVKCRLYK
ncbi:ABC transporter ATP-binding protein [bacterium]|nr:ABC transporter ATP-binding protein [bacterium]